MSIAQPPPKLQEQFDPQKMRLTAGQTPSTLKLQEQFDAGLSTRPDYTMDQPLDRYTSTDHAVWQQLYARQSALLPGRACDAFVEGLQQLEISTDRVPEFAVLNRQLEATTGWVIVTVPGLVPDQVFYDHLAHRRFPVSWWMRTPEQLDYLEEPDCFHDLFGHVPLLINPVFADFMQSYGLHGIGASPETLSMLARLYWYTAEFGLIADPDSPHGARIYGAGIVSSIGETHYSLESPIPNRLAFNLARIMRSRYRIDTYQSTYFVVDSFETLFTAAQEEFPRLLTTLAGTPEFAAGELVPNDQVLHYGTPKVD